MILIVGLGNPGKKYEKTRHNVGFRVIDELLKSKQLTVNKKQKKYKAEIFETELDNIKVILAKPQTFMNSSGIAVKKLFTIYCSLFANLFVVHDDIDLPLGKIRISTDRGAAGHKGVESIIRELKTRDFVRFRIGINQFAQNQKSKIKNQKLNEFVLKRFSKDEQKILKEIIKKTVEAIEMIIKEGVEKAQSIYNICARPST